MKERGTVLPNADPRVALLDGERQNEIDLGRGEPAEHLRLPVDPDRTARDAAVLDSLELAWLHRSPATVVGTFRTEREDRAGAARVATGWESPRSTLGCTAGRAMLRRRAGSRRSGV